MIKIRIPEFSYSGNIILEKLDHAFESGKTHGIVGLNGAGKTTFFNLLSGYISSENVSVKMNEQTIQYADIAFIDTELFFYPKLIGGEFLSVFPVKSESYNEQKLSELFRLPLDHFVEEYSTGMKKKILLMSQIKQNKDVYILDEPFNGLDLETNKILETIIAVLNKRGKTVFISSHILDPLLHVCDTISHIQNKSIQKTYTRNEFHLIEKDLFGDYTSKLKTELGEMI